ncbi:hypothetical protein BN000_01483 [Mycobacterium europaeum]|uniref:Uncharacterized protein n=1 Tax=Mycobacterium europaeum TaxID=761804 RepID=A0A0U1D3N3_9MYCO|nr:hypothetical protein [Mycobacterium europaeum]CQD07425.1 hypothetical protein BN000_01483 [Mycobacterium europaeum]
MNEITAPVVGGVPCIPRLQRVVNALPGYQRALEVAASADEWLRTQPPVPPVPADLEPGNTGNISDEWIAAVKAHTSATASYELSRNIVITEKQLAANRANHIVDTSLDLCLGALASDLTQLMQGAEHWVAELNGATTAEEAIAADAGPAWRSLTNFAAEYRDIRAAQSWLIGRAPQQIWRSCTPDLPGEDHANEAFIMNLADIWPNWRQGGTNMSTVFVGPGSAPNMRHEPWPADEYSAAMLVYLITSDAEPWLPTIRELRQMWEERRHPTEKQPYDEQKDTESSAFDSGLIGPLEAERKRQAAGGKPPPPRRAPDYSRVATPLRSKPRPRTAEIGAIQ